MFKKLFLNLLSLLVIATAYAQTDTTKVEDKPLTAQITWGNSYSIEGSGYHLFDWDSNGVYMYRNLFAAQQDKVNKHLNFSRIEKFNLALQRRAAMTIGQGDTYKDAAYGLERLVYIGGKNYVFTWAYDKDKAYIQLFVQEIDLKEMKLQGSRRLLSKTYTNNDKNLYEHTRGYSLTKAYNLPFEKAAFNYDQSPDWKKFLVTHFDSPSKSKIVLQLFDDQLKELWTRTISPSTHIKTDYTIQTTYLDSAANVYLLLKVYGDKTGRDFNDKGEPNYSYQVLQYSEQGTKVKKFEISLGDRFIEGTGFRFTHDGKQLVIAGFYMNQKTLTDQTSDPETVAREGLHLHLNGIYVVKIDLATQVIVSEKIIPLDEELKDTYFRGLVLRGDGSQLLTAEHLEGRGKQLYTNDIHIICIRADGTIDWKTKIEKTFADLRVGEMYTGGYLPFIYGSKLCFLYNNSDDEAVKLSVLDFEGKLQHINLEGFDKRELMLCPGFSLRASADVIWLYASDGTQFQLGKLKLE